MSYSNKFEKSIIERLEAPGLLEKLQALGAVNGHQNQAGKITYNKIKDAASFATFADVILDVVLNGNDAALRSMAIALPRQKHARVYTRYLLHYATLELSDRDSSNSVSTASGQDSIDELFDFVEQDTTKPTIGLCILQNPSLEMLHAIAFVAWIDVGGERHLAYYDPLMYKRRKRQPDDSRTRSFDFNYAMNAFAAYEDQMHVHSLAKYCLFKNDREYHCPQYIIDADYCYIFSLYFLMCWISEGGQTSEGCFERTVKRCFIVNPVDLVRPNTKGSMTFRVVMMSFLLHMLTGYLEKLRKKERGLVPNLTVSLSRMSEFNKAWHSSYGFYLMKPKGESVVQHLTI